MPLKPFLNLVNGLTVVPLTALSSQNTSRGYYWANMSSHKTWQGSHRCHTEEKRGKSCYWRLVRVWKCMEYLMEEVHCEALLVPGFGTLQGVQTSCSLGLFLPVTLLYFFFLSSDVYMCYVMISLSLGTCLPHHDKI